MDAPSIIYMVRDGGRSFTMVRDGGRSFTWFDMVDEHYDNELWYENFRVTRQTFLYLLNTVANFISCKDTVMRSSVSAKRRLAITLYFLASTAEYNTIANLFGVSKSFVCFCIIADPAYPLLPWVMKGFSKKDNQPRKEILFNYHLSRARMTVENTFGRWKGRFRRFSKCVNMEVRTLNNAVLASCILHNICEIQNNEFLPQWEEFERAEEVMIVADNVVQADANDIRDALADYFSH